MKKLIALLMALVMTMSLATVAWGAPVGAEALAAAAETGGTVNLDQNIELTGPITVKADLVVNLNGYTISSPGVYGVDPADDEGVFIIENASAGVSLTINGNDKATSKITTGDIAVWSKGNGTSANTIVLNGVKIESNYFGVYHNGSNYGADVTINNSTIVDGDGLGVYLSGSAAWVSADKMNKLTITNSSITGDTAVEVKRGNVEVTNSTLTATGTAAMEDDGNGPCTSGYALALTNSGAAEETVGDVTINSGTFTGDVGIKNEATSTDATVTITGGTFSVAPAEEYLADGLELVSNGAGGYTTMASATGTATDGYTLVTLTNGVPAATTKVDKNAVSVSKTSSSTTTVDGKSTTTVYADKYTVGGVVFYVCDDSIATHRLVKGGTVISLTTADLSAGVTKVVTSKVAAQLDVTKQVCGTPTGGVAAFVIDGKFYEVGGANKALLNGKVVTYGNEVAPVAHDFQKANGSVATYNAKGEPVSVTCNKCKASFSVVKADGVPASYTKVPTALDTAFGTGFYVLDVAASAGTSGGTTTGGTVTSAETFDAGIAMYVGMSVLAAAGSAVVIGKKKD